VCLLPIRPARGVLNLPDNGPLLHCQNAPQLAGGMNGRSRRLRRAKPLVQYPATTGPVGTISRNALCNEAAPLASGDREIEVVAFYSFATVAEQSEAGVGA
jgi:hypothetical protein